jgi:hypothetical protein
MINVIALIPAFASIPTVNDVVYKSPMVYLAIYGLLFSVSSSLYNLSL